MIRQLNSKEELVGRWKRKSKDQISAALISLPFRPKLISIGRSPGLRACAARSHRSEPMALFNSS